MKFCLIISLCISVVTSVVGQTIEITEIHYDNVGTATNKRVEVTATNFPGAPDANKVKLVFYHVSPAGSGQGKVYKSATFSSVSFQPKGTGTWVGFLNVPDIKDGPNCGIALEYESQFKEFISYEGSAWFATEGIAKTKEPQDIVVQENDSDTFSTGSLQKCPGGWIEYKKTNTFGDLNNCPTKPPTNAPSSSRSPTKEPTKAPTNAPSSSRSPTNEPTKTAAPVCPPHKGFSLFHSCHCPK